MSHSAAFPCRRRFASSSALALAIALAAPRTSPAAVRSSVFDDVKVWYKGSAGNAVGTKDSSSVTKMKNLPQLGEASSAMHGGTYFWWGWRMQYMNQKVDCPYAGVTLDSTPCMVVPSYADPTGYATVTINGEETTQPYWTNRRFGNLYFTNWMSDWASGTVCSNYTVVLRFRSDTVNKVSGNPNKIFDIGSLWDATAGKATGFSLNLNTPSDLADYVQPRTFVTTTQKNYADIKIKHGRWVDFTLAVDGAKATMWFCWNDGTDETPTNKLATITETYPTTKGLPTISAGCRVNLASLKDAYSASFTNGVYNADMGTKAFEGAFHQIAFWDRTLSDDEIREAMAGGTGRPNLVDVGMEGNGTAEFAATPTKTSVATDGDWENMNPALTAGNPSATITFDCPTLWAGLPQWLRVAGAGAGRVSASLNGETLGEIYLPASGSASFFVPEGKIASGANTLVLTRLSGSPVIDAVRLGGSWKFGESIGSFATSADATSLGSDKYVFHPACGNDKLHARGLNIGKGNRTHFDFFVPENMVGKFRGLLATRTQNTDGTEKNFHFYANGAKFGEYKLKGGVTTEVKIPETAVIAGWNKVAWESQSGGDWANIDWHKFTLQPAPTPFVIVVR